MFDADNSASFGISLVGISDGAVLVIVCTMPALVKVVDVSTGMAEGAMVVKG